MMTVYFVVMTICTGLEGCVEERRPGPTYASRQICLETTREMTPRKGVKFKCRSERSNVIFTEAPRPESYEGLVSTKVQGQP